MKKHRKNFMELDAKIMRALSKGEKFTRAELSKKVGSTSPGLSKITLQNHLENLKKHVTIFLDADGKYKIQATCFYETEKMKNLNRDYLFGKLANQLYEEWVLKGYISPEDSDFWENNIILFVPQKINGIIKSCSVLFCPLRIYEKLLKSAIE